MAEFCKECFKKNILTSSDNIADSQLMLSAAWDICEGCGEYKQIVVGIEETEMSLYNEEQIIEGLRSTDSGWYQSILSLINRLKAELQICNEALDNSMKLNTKLQAEIERLKEIEYMYNDTNHDRIRNMDLDEMATSIYKYVHNTCRFCVYSKGWKCTSALKTCVHGIKQWLRSEAEDEE